MKRKSLASRVKVVQQADVEKQGGGNHAGSGWAEDAICATYDVAEPQQLTHVLDSSCSKQSGGKWLCWLTM